MLVNGCSFLFKILYPPISVFTIERYLPGTCLHRRAERMANRRADSNDMYRRAVDEGWNYPANVVLLYGENQPQL
ncbi:unnamed protein product [Citrullus colocynthis]|uniref:Uncharacterized protein n=1 Tax=Citrullus colocynthis TaxID=252529 RepID=A0ABP0YM15_9ROSI